MKSSIIITIAIAILRVPSEVFKMAGEIFKKEENNDDIQYLHKVDTTIFAENFIENLTETIPGINDTASSSSFDPIETSSGYGSDTTDECPLTTKLIKSPQGVATRAVTYRQGLVTRNKKVFSG